MNEYLSFGTKIVFLALASYAIGTIIEQRRRVITNNVLIFISAGIVFDIIATIFMILGTSNSLFSLHGIIGYSSLLAMIIDALLLWRFRLKFGAVEEVNYSLHLYSRFAFLWWVIAFITGLLLVIFK